MYQYVIRWRRRTDRYLARRACRNEDRVIVGDFWLIVLHNLLLVFHVSNATTTAAVVFHIIVV